MRTRYILACCLVLAALLLAACTRDRPAPEAAPTAAGGTPVATDVALTPAATVAEPVVVELTETPSAEGALTPEAQETPTPAEEGELFTYIVEQGDTLMGLALRYETDVETLRRLNDLGSDAIQAGQPLEIPLKPGMTAEGAPTATPTPFIYEVQAGDTLGGIALRFGVNPIDIIEENNILDPNAVPVGAPLRIPGYQAGGAEGATGGQPAEGSSEGSAPAAAGEGVQHVVQPGETLSAIAQLYGVDAATIAQANGIANGNLLRAGSTLTIPGVSARDAAGLRGQVHVVQSGESLLGIAAQYGVTVEAIMEANDLSNPDNIVVGNELIIPAP